MHTALAPIRQQNRLVQLVQSLTLGVCMAWSGAQAQTDPALLKSTATDRAAKLAAAAKAEGGLTLYTSIAEKDLKPLIDPFEKKYGVKVTTWRASGDSVMNRTINEFIYFSLHIIARCLAEK